MKEELRVILPQLEEMQNRKCDRRNQFVEVLEQIQKISNEIYMSSEYTPSKIVVDEADLSLRKLEELHRELQALQKEKVSIPFVSIFNSFPTSFMKVLFCTFFSYFS